MSITILEKSLFTPGYAIKYITGWDNLFRPEKFSGPLKFYPSNPKYIVDVAFLVDRNVLREEDIIVTAGTSHNNPDDIRRRIVENTDIIYEICRSSPAMEFALDLSCMHILEDSDFTQFLPVYGLNTFFKFENVSSSCYYCLVNSTRGLKDSDFYAWFLSYIYSSIVCLAPRSKLETYPRVFLQAISSLSASNGNRKAVHVSSKPTIMDCGLNTSGEMLFPVPGNTKRFEDLVGKAIEQMSAKRRK